MRELLFADDSPLIAHSAEEMQKIVDAFSDASKKFGLKINIKKTEVLYQSNSTRKREEDIMVDGNKQNLCNNSGSAIDLILVTDHQKVCKSGVLNVGISDNLKKKLTVSWHTPNRVNIK